MTIHVNIHIPLFLITYDTMDMVLEVDVVVESTRNHIVDASSLYDSFVSQLNLPFYYNFGQMHSYIAKTEKNYRL